MACFCALKTRKHRTNWIVLFYLQYSVVILIAQRIQITLADLLPPTPPHFSPASKTHAYTVCSG